MATRARRPDVLAALDQTTGTRAQVPGSGPAGGVHGSRRSGGPTRVHALGGTGAPGSATRGLRTPRSIAARRNG